jgi:hypothetical protein
MLIQSVAFSLCGEVVKNEKKAVNLYDIGIPE